MSILLDFALNVMGPLVLAVAVASLFAWRFKPDTRTLSTLIVYLFSPFLVLDGIARSSLTSDEFGQIAVFEIVLTLLLAAIGYALTRALRYDQRLQSAFLLCVLLTNSANIGLPLNEFAFGDTGYERAMVFFVVSTIIVNTFGVFLASRGSVPVRQSLLNVVRVPMIYGLVLGLTLSLTGTALPLPIQRAVTLLGQAAVPVMTVLLGLQLIHTRLRGRLGPIALATALRLVVSPLLAFGLVAVMGITGVTRQVMILQAGTPTAIISGALATQFGSDEEFTTSVILTSTVASALTLSVLLALVR